MRSDLFVALCAASGFLRSGNVCSAATIYLSASASTDGLLTWKGWASSSPTWIIVAPFEQKVLLSFDELQIGYPGYSCGTYLEVRDGQNSWSSLLTKQCYTSIPPSPVYSSGRYLYVRFNANYGSSSYNRVSAMYRVLPASSAECPNVLLGNNTGVIYSPRFPDDYTSDTSCYWTISAPRPSYNYLLLNFTVLELEYSSNYDCYDYVIVRDGEHSWSHQLAKYCKSSYSPVVLVPSGRDARVEFKSDGSRTAKGFLLFIRFTYYQYVPTVAPPVTWWPTTAWWWTTPTPYQWWATTPRLDSTHRTLAIVLPIVAGVILMFVIIMVVACEKGKRQSTPPPVGPAPPVVELQTFPHQVPFPTQQPQQPVTVVANSPPQFSDEPRAELAGQTGRDLPPPNSTDWVTFSDQQHTESHDPAAQQPNLAQGENYYAPPPV